MRDRRLTPEQRSARQREAYARWRAKNESIRAVREQGTGDVMFPHGVRNGTTPNSVLIERERATASRLSITAALMGDPLPGRSALDKFNRCFLAEPPLLDPDIKVGLSP